MGRWRGFIFDNRSGTMISPRDTKAGTLEHAISFCRFYLILCAGYAILWLPVHNIRALTSLCRSNNARATLRSKLVRSWRRSRRSRSSAASRASPSTVPAAASAPASRVRRARPGARPCPPALARSTFEVSSVMVSRISSVSSGSGSINV